MSTNILYYYQQPGGDFMPSLKRIYCNRLIVSKHAADYKAWGLEIGFKHAQVYLKYFLIPSLFCFTDKFSIWQFWKLGLLQCLTFRLGKFYAVLCLTDRKYKRHMDAILKDALPTDFYQVEIENKAGATRYNLYFNYDFNDSRKAMKLREPKLIQTYESAPAKTEIYRQIMLNDGYRWRRAELKEGEQFEISERVYYFLQNCMPPRNWNGTYFELGEIDHHDDKGVAIHRACKQVGDKYYSGHPKTIYMLTPQ